MVIPPEAVEAAAQAAWDSALPTYWQAEGGSWEPMPAWAEAGDTDRLPPLEAMRVGLAAALPHLRPLFETATKVALELGRKEALKEVADEMGVVQDDPRIGYVTLQTDHGTWRTLMAARDIGPKPQDSEVECSCYKLPRAEDGLLRHHSRCPNRPRPTTGGGS